MIKVNILSERKRKRIFKTKKSFYRNYNFELIVTGLLLLGFFLLWERWHIKSIVWDLITNTARIVVNYIRDIAVQIGETISKVETSDLIGIILILVAVFLIINRTRLRIINSHPSLSSCFKCEEDLRRIQRKIGHKLLERLLFCKIKRYKCRTCSFEEIEMTTTLKSRH